MIPQRFEGVCPDSQDGMLANYLAIRLANIEEAMIGANLKIALMECDVEYVSPEEERKRKEKVENIEKALFVTHNKHKLDLIKTIVDDLSVITVEIERVHCADVNLLLRQHYCELKDVMCENPDAMAYYLKKS
jgi:hypothetical protein